MAIDEKGSLELRKLALEIADLERSWWKRPAYILGALPTLLALGTVLVAVFSGYFQAAYIKLENQRHDIEAQVKEFEAKREDLHKQNDKLQQLYDNLHQQYDKEKQALDEMKETSVTISSKAALRDFQVRKCREELQALKSKRQK
jgi:septal ring factor EnvC (AmiA/AmiB activator)